VNAPKRSGARASAESDAVILARVAGGDLVALGAVYDRYAPGLLRFAARAAGSEEAEDVVQATFLRVIRLAAAFDPSVASARPWLFAITARIVQERRRSLRRWRAALLGLAQQQQRSPSRQLTDARADLSRGLDGLSVAKRTVLILAEVEGFTCEELATMLSIPVGTVWTRLHHARNELRRRFEEES
jgi:RNA polymerase sigma factor (sigma-70 family)